MQQSEDIPELAETNEVKVKAARKSTLVSVVVNTFLSIIQLVVGFFSGSQGLVSDGIHSFSDLFSDFVVLVANKKSQRGPDEDHPYGHHRYENAASLILGGVLLVVGVGMLLSALHKLRLPDTIASVHPVALVIAVLSLILKEILFRYMIAVATRVKSSMLVANAWHARSDAASSFVVAIGIIGNLLGYKLFDPIAAFIVGIMIFKMGATFFWEAFNDLMDRAADSEIEEKIKKTILDIDGVQGIHEFKTRKMGDLIVVDVHIEVDGELTVRCGHDIAAAARKKVMAMYDVLNMMTHIDPI